MKLNLDNIQYISMCYENCEVDKIEQSELRGIYIQRKTKSKHSRQDKISYNIKTFEIALNHNNYEMRHDLAQLTIHYTNGEYDHFFITWGKDDISWDHSSLQKTHHSDKGVSLTSNCESVFVQ